MGENVLSSGKSKHIDVRWHFIRDLVKTKALSISLFKMRRKRLTNLRDGEWLRMYGKITSFFFRGNKQSKSRVH